MDLQQEKELVERARCDTAAFGELYEAYYSPIFGYILRRTASLAAAQDITAEVFLKALQNLKRFRWQGVPFSAWLYRIAAHEIADHHRHNGRRALSLEDVTVPLADGAPTAEEELIAAEAELQRKRDYLALQACVARLPARYQEVIALRFWENKSLFEIGEILGKKNGTIKSLIHRALEKLRQSMNGNATFQKFSG